MVLFITIPNGTVCHETISLVDVLATIASLTGHKLPPVHEAAEDSHNFLPLLFGEKPAEALHPYMIVHSADGIFAIRRGPWKWIEGIPAQAGSAAKSNAAPEAKLYNLADDPQEKRDVSKEHPEMAVALAKQLALIRKQGFSRK